MLQKFDSWYPLRMLSVSVLPSLGDFPAVYAFRDNHNSEILYIGQTGCIRRRMFRNYLGGIGGGTTQRIRGYLFDDGKIQSTEVAWIRAENPKEEETQLLAEYRSTHNNETPPWNRL